MGRAPVSGIRWLSYIFFRLLFLLLLTVFSVPLKAWSRIFSLGSLCLRVRPDIRDLQSWLLVPAQGGHLNRMAAIVRLLAAAGEGAAALYVLAASCSLPSAARNSARISSRAWAKYFSNNSLLLLGTSASPQPPV